MALHTPRKRAPARACRFDSYTHRQFMIDITSKNESREFPQDIVLAIENLTKDAAGNYHIIGKGTYHSILVGLEVIIRGGMKHGIVNDDFETDQTAFYKGVIFKSIGSESDEFIKAMASLYGITTGKTFSSNPMPFTSFAMEKEPLDIERKPVRFKLFFDDTDELGLYCELYLNIDAPAGVLEMKEKSDEYRKNIVKALTL